jgi:hypothetical protein
MASGKPQATEFRVAGRLIWIKFKIFILHSGGSHCRSTEIRFFVLRETITVGNDVQTAELNYAQRRRGLNGARRVVRSDDLRIESASSAGHSC